MRNLLAALLFLIATMPLMAAPAWERRLDSEIVFYRLTDLGVVIAATERSLYGFDARSGEQMWRRASGGVAETAITPVPGTDVVLFSRDLGSRSRMEALDVLTGGTVWQSEKLKGDALQLAADPELDLLAVVMVKDTRGEPGREMKREPVIHMLRFSTGDELWKRTLESDVDMMPARFGDGIGEVSYTLDNYRAPLMIDGRLLVFYEGTTSYDARTGREIERETFKVNEGGLALTEADPVFDDRYIFISGRGRIRAVERSSGRVAWKADDLGNAAEMAVVNGVLFVRTGGQFTRLRDGETESKGPYGVAAVDTSSGKVLWRYKGADKGITNFAFRDENTIVIADRDDLISIDTRTGKRTSSAEHKVDRPQFVIFNENLQAVVGGRDELAAFSPQNNGAFRETWRVRHKAPGRGALRVIAGIALRAAGLYFRYGGLATSALGLVRGGLRLASAANSFRWSGLSARLGSFDLTTLAAGAAREYALGRIYSLGSLGSLASLPDAARRLSGFSVITPSGVRSSIAGGIARRAVPSGEEIGESIFDRLDPVRYSDRLADHLLRKKRLSELRGNIMYFYTELPRPYGGRGLIGVNVHNGRDARIVPVGDPDPNFTVDETTGILYSADGSRLQAFDAGGGRPGPK